MARRPQFPINQDARPFLAPARAMRRLGAVAALTAGVLLAVQACERSPFEPVETAPAVRSPSRRADLDPAVNIATLLDSLAIGGVYSVTQRGGYSSLRYTLMPERAVYANPIRGHPTGIELPVGLPVRVLAEGAVVSHSTPTFLTSYCARYGGGDSHCATPSYTYTAHGLAPDGVLTNPYALGTGLQVQWSRLGGRYAAPYPSPEFFSGAIPASGAATTAELHFRREAGCCYYPPFGDAVYTAWETYEGQWRFAVVMDDGGRPENGVPALLTLSGPRTNQPMADSATFTLTAADGGTPSEARWWFIQPVSNAFDGEPLPFVQEPSSGLMVPRYPDGQRSVITEIPECATQVTCRYQAAHSGALVAMAKMPNGSYLGAGNRGLNRPHVRITVDSTTLAQGDTTVFRSSAPGAKELRVTGYSFVPSAPVTALAMRGSRALRVPGTASGGPAISASSPQRPAARQGTSTSATEGVTAVRGGRKAHFLDATFDCSDVADTVCYDNPPQTGYEVVTATVDGALQRDSVLVTVVPQITVEIVDAGGPNPGESFLARKDGYRGKENVITLRARVTPAAFADSVRWEVTGMPLHDAISTIAPDTAPRGLATSFVVPRANINPGSVIKRLRVPQRYANDTIILPGRWPTVHDTLRRLPPRALAYRITATITVNGQTVRSAPDTIRQNEIDVLRQEYVDFGLRWVPDTADVGRQGNAARNLTGDYSVWLSERRLLQQMPIMQALSERNYNGFSPVVMSGFRNPVHHFIHANAHSVDSQHLHGNATDWGIVDASDRPPRYDKEACFTELWRMTRNSRVDGCWEPARVIRETNRETTRPSEKLNHAHTDWRVRCPDTWNER